MFFSIIVPIYNVENDLDCCLKSINDQTEQDFEAIMVDDGSKDGSTDIAKSYTKYENFKYFRKENGGLSNARNYGIERSKGEYLIFVDSDDYLNRDALKIIKENIIKNNVDVLEYNAQKVFSDGKENEIFAVNYKENGEISNGLEYMVNRIKNGTLYAPVWLKAVKRKLITDKNLWFEKGRLHEDELWTPKMFFYADRVLYINKILYNYKIREGSITQSKNKVNNIKDTRKNCIELEQFYMDNKIDTKTQKVLRDYLVRQYIGAVSLDSTIKYKISSEDISFTFRNVHSAKTLAKLLIFCVAPNYYLKIKKKANQALKKC